MKLGIKITAIVLVVLILSLSLTACSNGDTNSFLNEITLGLWDRILLDENEHDVVVYVDSDTVTYQGNTYYLAPMIFIQDSATTVREERGYEYIGWTGFRFFYIDIFHGDSKDSPNILYESRLENTYFREDYDYKADIFKIESTEDVICFGEDLIETSHELPYSLSAPQYIVLQSSTHASLSIKLGILSHNGVWYARSMDFVHFELSENFVEVLMKNQIIK